MEREGIEPTIDCSGLHGVEARPAPRCSVAHSMPTYVYRFVDTAETIEVQQSFTDDALTEATHPVTGEVLPVKKVITPVGVTFKGGGFYKTDSRGKSSSTKPSPASSDSPSSESKKEPAPSSTDSSSSTTSSTAT
jgi:predicted nucleic acid-binding Zn ribbon protein